MGVDIEIREIDPQPFMAVYFKCSREDLGKHFGEAIPAAFGYVASQGKQPVGMPVGQYLSGTPEEFEVAAGVPVAEPMEESDQVKNATLPGGRVAVARHLGPYEKLIDTHMKLEAWLKENGHQPNGGVWEVYVSDPGAEPDESKWVTDIYAPIA